MNKRLIFYVARTSVKSVAVRLLARNGIEVSRSQKEDMFGAALEAIAIVMVKYPQHSQNSTYLMSAAKQKIWKFLLGHPTVKKRAKGELPPFCICSIDANLSTIESQIIPPSSSSWVEDRQEDIFNLLLNSRTRKGKRGTDAARRESKIILLASYGWSNKAIGDEIGMNPDTVKQTRRRLTRLFKDQLHLP